MAQPAMSSRRGSPEARALRRAVLRLQRGVQLRFQAHVRAHTGSTPPALERYHRAYLRDLRRTHRVSSYGELHAAVLEADLVLIGDYHTLRQSQQVALGLLERTCLDSRPVCLALEMLHAEHQPHVDAYLAGMLPEADFLAAIDYGQTWNFDWGNYRPLFEAARRHGERVVGINHGGRPAGIHERDDRIARSLVDQMLAQPAARFVVLIGDMHLASKHLPAALDRQLAGSGLGFRRLIVYQNSDALYWDLAQRGVETDTQVVRMGADRFCVLEVPPYVKLQSYLGWEQALERWHLDDRGDGPEPTATAVLEHLVRRFGEMMGMGAGVPGCEVYVEFDEDFFETLRAARLSDERLREVHLHTFSNRSCYVPEAGLVYLPFLSVNHAAEESLHVLWWRSTGFVPGVADAQEDFYRRTLWAALGFMASKIVNPRRRADDEATLRAFHKAASRRLHDPDLAYRKLVARLVLQHKDHERARRRGRDGRLGQIYGQDLEVTLEVTQALGYMLGEHLALGLRAGELRASDLRRVMLAAGSTPASTLYHDLVDRLEV